MSAFRLADRRCRILPSPEPHCYALRGEASFAMGNAAAAISDIVKALAIAPDDIASNRRMLAWGEGPQQRRAASALIGHDRDVILVAPVMIAGDIARLVEPGVARSVGEAVPDAAAGAVGGGRSFDLVRGSRCSPQKIIGETVGAIHSIGRFTIARMTAWRV